MDPEFCSLMCLNEYETSVGRHRNFEVYDDQVVGSVVLNCRVCCRSWKSWSSPHVM
jgi:hypothetical protein